MTTHEAFLQAIIEAPEDDTPRLVYADWLTDHDDPNRAEFIRVQCRLAGMDEDDPERLDLMRREYDLFADHGPDWSAPLVGRVMRWRFRRGFVEQVKSSVTQFLKAADWLLAFTPLRELDVRSAYKADDLRPLAGSKHLRRITRLKVNYHHIGDEGVRLLADSPNVAGLTHLSLNGTWCTREGLHALGASPHLQALRSLEVEKNYALGAPEVFAAFVSSCRLPRLERLKWDKSKGIGLVGLRALLAAPLAERITDLEVRDGDIGIDGMRLLADTIGLPRLRKLVIQQTRRNAPAFPPADLSRALASSPLLPRLHTLELRSSEQGDSGVAELARAPAGSLRRLKLFSGQIGEEGARTLADAPLCESLTRLDLSFNRIGDRGLAALLASPRLSRLRHLDLGWCGLTHLGAKALLASTRLGQFEHINLDGNKIGRIAFVRLRQRVGERLQHSMYDRGAGDSGIIRRIESEPPRCLHGLGAKPDTDLIRRFPPNIDYEYVGVSFELTPPDPSQKPVLLGYEGHGGLFLSPFAIRWEPSGRQRELYDSEQHGGYAESDYNDTNTGSGERQEWQCGVPGCGDHIFIATIAHRRGDTAGRSHDRYVPFSDLFFNFCLDVYCASQDKLIRIASFVDK